MQTVAVPRARPGSRAIPNTFAYVVLGAWPFVCLALFARLEKRAALVMSIVGGFLLLPSATIFKLSGLPDLDKAALVSIGALIGALLFGAGQARARGGIALALLAGIFVLTPVATAQFNADPLISPKLYFPGMTLYDGVSLVAVHLLVLTPFYLGRQLLGDDAGHRSLLTALVGLMLLYSILILIEVRLSPQLHRWVYGFFPHSFGQQMRGDGFRAVVFLQHGLVVALFLALAFVTATAFVRPRVRILACNPGVVASYLAIVLLLQKSLGAAVLAATFGVVVLFMSPRRQIAVAALCSALILFYPVVRASELLPFDAIRAAAAHFSEDRAGSLETRLVNEERLLAKAQERPFFGWGTWARNRVYDLEEGKDISITDGTWIITIGTFGWFGYMGLFGLLTYPVFRLYLMYRRWPAAPPWEAAILSMILTLNLCDLVPNSSLTPVTWLVAGALVGHRRKSRPAGATRRVHGVEDPEAATQVRQ